MNKYSKHIKLILILMAITFIVFLPYILGDRPFLFSADQQLQYNYFYREYQRMLMDFINKKTFPFYSFNTYLGNNFYSSKLYYLTGDIFMPILLFSKNIEKSLMYITLFLVVLSGFNFSMFLRNFGLKKESVIITTSIIYAFSGIASLYVGQYMFHRFYAFLPLLIMGIEIYCRKKKLTFFVLSVTILSLTSYYFLFPTCIFMVFYYFFTNYYHGRDFNVFKILKSSLPLIFSFFVGLMIAGILLVPGFKYILQNERIGHYGLSLFYELKVYLGFILNYICAPITLFTNYGYMFNSGSNGHLTWYSIYTGIISAPIIFSLLKNDDRKEKSIFIMEIILVVFALIPFLSSFMHGFSESSMRWMFLISFFNNLIIAIYLTHFENKLKKIVEGSFIYIITLIFVLLPMFISIKIEVNHVFVIVISLIILFIYTILLKKGNLKLILILCCIEVPLMNSIHLFLLNSTYYKYTPTLDENTLNYYKSMDVDKFYRIYVNPDDLLPTSTMNLNQAINLDFNSTMTYDSTIEPNLSLFNKLNGYNWHIVNINNFEALKMLGVKYFIVSDESKLPDGKFTYYNNVNHLKMYLYEDYMPIGFTYSKFKTELNLTEDDNGNIVQHDLDFTNELFIDGSLKEKVSDITESERNNFELIEYYNDNQLYGHITNSQKQLLFFSIPYSEGWKVFDNQVKLETYKVQGGFLGVILEEGDHYISLQFTPPWFKYGVYTSLIGLICFGFVVYNDYKVSKYDKK